MAKVDISLINGIDDKDKAILYMLYEDARVSLTDMSKKIGLTRPAIKTRMEALENKGIINGYRVVINSESSESGLKFMLLVSADSAHVLEVAEMLSLFRVHKEVYSKTGYCNLVAIGFVKDQKEFKAYEKKVFYKVKNNDFVQDATLHLLINTFKDVDGGIDYDKRKFKYETGDEE